MAVYGYSLPEVYGGQGEQWGWKNLEEKEREKEREEKKNAQTELWLRVACGTSK